MYVSDVGGCAHLTICSVTCVTGFVALELYCHKSGDRIHVFEVASAFLHD